MGLVSLDLEISKADFPQCKIACLIENPKENVRVISLSFSKVSWNMHCQAFKPLVWGGQRLLWVAHVGKSKILLLSVKGGGEDLF